MADLVQSYTAEVARDREQPLTPKRSPVSDLELAPVKLRVLLNCCQQRIFEGAVSPLHGLVEVQAHIDEAAQLCEGGTICGLGPSQVFIFVKVVDVMALAPAHQGIAEASRWRRAWALPRGPGPPPVTT